VLKGEKPYTEAPRLAAAASRSGGERAEIEEKLERNISDQELASYLMYPKVFTDFAAQRDLRPGRRAADAGLFLRLQAGDEIAIDLEPGKTLVVRCQAIGETDENGDGAVFFELNGQPRTIKVPDRAMARRARRARKADPTNRPCRRADAGRHFHVAVKAGQRSRPATCSLLGPSRR
jgi:pyruvate carboxylase